MLQAGQVISKSDIEQAMTRQKVAIQEGDVVLFHTGWMNLSASDGVKFMAGEPGIGVEGAVYLAQKKVVAVGSDTYGLEAVPFEEKGTFYPVHQELLAKRGIYILENMDTREMASDQAWEFMFVLGQPRFEGSVQAVINPVAIR